MNSNDKPGAAWAQDILQAFDGATVVYVEHEGTVRKDERTWHRGESAQATQRS